MAEAPPESSGSGLSEEMLRVIRGEVPVEEKRDLYRDSLGRQAVGAVPGPAGHIQTMAQHLC